MTRDEKRAYARGYNNRAKWPDHIPPSPPQPIVAEVMAAGKEMRDWIDNQRAMGAYEESEVGHLLDRFYSAMVCVGEWIREAVK